MSGEQKRAMDPETRRTRGRQLLLFSALAAAVLIIFALWFSAGGDDGSPPPGGIRAELAGSETAEASWVRRSEARIGGLETRLREMETQARRSGEENAKLRARLARDAEDGREVIDRQAAVVDELRRRLETRATPPAPAGRTKGGANGVFAGAGNRTPSEGKIPTAPDGAAGPPAPMIQEFETGTAPVGKGGVDRGPRPLKSWLPAGSYADAVVLAGVDASAGVASQGDPEAGAAQADRSGPERGRWR